MIVLKNRLGCTSDGDTLGSYNASVRGGDQGQIQRPDRALQDNPLAKHRSSTFRPPEEYLCLALRKANKALAWLFAECFFPLRADAGQHHHDNKCKGSEQERQAQWMRDEDQGVAATEKHCPAQILLQHRPKHKT